MLYWGSVVVSAADKWDFQQKQYSYLGGLTELGTRPRNFPIGGHSSLLSPSSTCEWGSGAAAVLRLIKLTDAFGWHWLFVNQAQSFFPHSLAVIRDSSCSWCWGRAPEDRGSGPPGHAPCLCPLALPQCKSSKLSRKWDILLHGVFYTHIISSTSGLSYLPPCDLFQFKRV